MLVRTGRDANFSAPRLAVMAAAVLAQDDSPPQVTRQLEKLFGQRHGLVEIGQEITKGLVLHRFSP